MTNTICPCGDKLKMVSLGVRRNSPEYTSEDFIQKCPSCGIHRFVASTKFHDEYGGPKMFFGKWMAADVCLYDLMYPKNESNNSSSL